MSKLKLYIVLVTAIDCLPHTFAVRAGRFDVATRKAMRAYRRANPGAKAMRSSTQAANLTLIL